jgi:hypothetical protein
LYRNKGDGTFENVSESAGLRKVYGNGLGVAVGDFNNDGHIDFYVANDQVPNRRRESFLSRSRHVMFT